MHTPFSNIASTVVLLFFTTSQTWCFFLSQELQRKVNSYTKNEHIYLHSFHLANKSLICSIFFSTGIADQHKCILMPFLRQNWQFIREAPCCIIKYLRECCVAESPSLHRRCESSRSTSGHPAWWVDLPFIQLKQEIQEIRKLHFRQCV